MRNILLKNTSLLAITILIGLTSCAKIYYSPDSYQLARNHKKIAIVPPVISIPASKKIDAAAIKEQQRTESLNFQNEIYSWMLRRSGQGKFHFETLDVEYTNAKLAEIEYPAKLKTPAELCQILGVDGVLVSNFALSKPISEGGAIALALLAGFGGATNEIYATLSLHDGSNKKLIWNYNHKFSGGIGSSPSRLIDQIMRKASKKMPYNN